jgi:cob(I)alamin adenosyltransferase
VNKIYTRGGDKGQTGLFSGPRVSKNDPLIHALGSLDELNTIIGIARSLHVKQDRLAEILHRLQNELFEAGAELGSGHSATPRITDEHVTRFEGYIDELTAGLAPLANFILPGGHPVAAHLHQARTVCRRAERAIIAATDEVHISPALLAYVNRLSDLLFTLAREANRVYGLADVKWEKLS